MAQQGGSGAAPAASQTKATPGGASGMNEADPRQNGTKPGPGDKASRGVMAGGQPGGGQPGDVKASRVRGWLRRNPQGAFFFSSRRRHTRCGRDWSSDVCSSD